MTYDFTMTDLSKLYAIHGEGGPREAYRMFHDLTVDDDLITVEVENFIHQFYSQYNEKICAIY